jgi:predicted ATPase
MRLTNLRARRYLSLRDVELELGALNVFIGANAAGKSNILNALRFLAEGVARGDFAGSVASRGGLIHLAWKGEEARDVEIESSFANGKGSVTWRVRLIRAGHDFVVEENLREEKKDSPPNTLLDSRRGKGWWWSPAAKKQIPLEGDQTGCALTAAARDASFPAKGVADFVRQWGFFDPNPSNLRRASSTQDKERLDSTGSNLAGRLYTLSKEKPAVFERIVNAARDVLGVPDVLQFRESEEDGHVYFVQREKGLTYNVHQVGTSSGTLRMLALMTALFGESEVGLVGIEEPENHIHPSALSAFAEYLKQANQNVQILVTTHSPLFLDRLAAPEAVCVVLRDQSGTRVKRETNPQAVHKALEQSGFGLGELLQTKGFGA